MWLTRVPFALVRACVAMLPRLKAEESMRASQEIAVGTGSLDRHESRRVTGAWVATATAADTRKQRPTSAALAAMGIGFTIVP